MPFLFNNKKIHENMIYDRIMTDNVLYSLCSPKANEINFHNVIDVKFNNLVRDSPTQLFYIMDSKTLIK